jgi:hypothetical protein
MLVTPISRKSPDQEDQGYDKDRGVDENIRVIMRHEREPAHHAAPIAGRAAKRTHERRHYGKEGLMRRAAVRGGKHAGRET